MAKTTIDDEIEERVDYFADWVKKLSDEKDESRVVNERTAAEFIKNAFQKDSNLSNLLEGMESSGKGMRTLVKSTYIQSLISANQLGIKLEEGTAKLRKKRESLEQLIPKRQGATRKKVIKKFTNAQLLKQYNIKKDKNNRYHDTRTGKYVSYDKILKITDLVILKSAAKRKELERFMANINKK